jgi:dephospho-CoA kinase
LEGILHPRVIAEEQKIYSDRQRIDPEAIVIIESALLIESQNYKNVDKVIVVQSTQELQIQRVMNRDGESRASVKNRLKSQMSLEEKLNYADYVLDNTSVRDLLKSQVHCLYTEFKSLA